MWSPIRAVLTRVGAQAVYFEAGFQPLAGKRAVAQVVVNRVRDRNFPHSVCGVVYQGWRRGVGCQFSFVCDGSLWRRPPTDEEMASAKAVARQALSGYVETAVGTATHYHSRRVNPAWARQRSARTRSRRYLAGMTKAGAGGLAGGAGRDCTGACAGKIVGHSTVGAGRPNPSASTATTRKVSPNIAGVRGATPGLTATLISILKLSPYMAQLHEKHAIVIESFFLIIPTKCGKTRCRYIDLIQQRQESWARHLASGDFCPPEFRHFLQLCCWAGPVGGRANFVGNQVIEGSGRTNHAKAAGAPASTTVDGLKESFQ